MDSLTPKPVADTGTEPPCASGPLLSTCLGNAHLFETSQSTCRIETGLAGITAVDHYADTFDGQAGFGDIGCQHHLSTFSGIDRLFLLGVGECTVQRTDIDSVDILEQLPTAVDFTGSRQECQNVTFSLT